MPRSVRALSVLLLAVGVLVVPEAGAATATCKVSNTRTQLLYVGRGSNLQDAIDEAARGDTLRVRGSCVGVFAIRGEVRRFRLTLKGVATERYPVPILDARQRGRVLAIRRASVTIEHLMLTGGLTRRSGGGIYDRGSLLVLAGTTAVVANRAGSGGGGIYNFGGVVRLEGSARVARNRTGGPGGGIENRGDGTVTLTDSAVVARNRAAAYDGGGIANAWGTVRVFDDARVARNRSMGNGGGIDSHDAVVLADAASVLRNVAVADGGGVHLSTGGTVRLKGSARVRRNAASTGGGVMIRDGSTATLRNSASVTANRASNRGGGIAVKSKANTPHVYVCSSRVAISPNVPDDPPEISPCPQATPPRWRGGPREVRTGT